MNYIQQKNFIFFSIKFQMVTFHIKTSLPLMCCFPQFLEPQKTLIFLHVLFTLCEIISMWHFQPLDRSRSMLNVGCKIPEITTS
jgi:hypothetical protein